MKNLKTIDKIKNSLYPILTFLFILVIWQGAVKIYDIPQYVLPSPSDIVQIFFKDYQNLYTHTIVTLNEAVIGFIVSIILSIGIGILMDFIPLFKKCVYPIMLVSQTIPTITIAPLLIIWFGFDSLPKVIMVTLTCFFPILINFVDGIENIDKDYLNLFKTMNSNKLKTFIHLKFPMSLDKLFSGLKISATYAVVAATVAEWLGGTEGLGVYMVRSKSAYALDKVFASTILVVIFSLVFVAIIQAIKKVVLKYKN